jgi:hypothetical protein
VPGDPAQTSHNPVLANFLVADDSTTMFFSERLSLGELKKHVEMSREQKGRAIKGLKGFL